MTGHQSLDVLIGIIVAVVLALLLAIAALAFRRPEDRTHQLEAAYRRFSSSATVPGRNRRLGLRWLVLGVLVILNVVWLGFFLSRALGDRPVDSTQSTATGGISSSAASSPASAPKNGSPEQRTIQLVKLPQSAEPFQTVRIQGTYRGRPETFLQVERWEGGKWVAFPLPTKTDRSGRFSTYVEFGQPGSYPLRVVDASSGLKSKTFVLVIKG
jgi:MFS superfamily sulfate permease-like transporter